MKIWTYIKNVFKLTKLKRFILLGFFLTGAILSIILGSIFYTVPSARLGSAYAGGAEYVVAINVADNSDRAKEIATDVALSVRERVDGLGVVGVSTDAEISDNGANVRVVYPGIKSKEEKDAVEQLITKKPHLTFTDYYGNPLFNFGGTFSSQLNGDPGRFIHGDIVEYSKEAGGQWDGFREKSNVPIAEAESVFQDSYKVQINLQKNKSTDWYFATEYISKLPEDKQMVIAWLDLDDFIKEASTNWPQEWAESGNNPFLFAHVNNDPSASLKKHQVDSEKYMISKAAVAQPLSGSSFVIEGANFNASTSQTLARQINYGVSDYTLELVSSSFIDAEYGQSAFSKAMIAGAIVFLVIAIFLILNYGILGLLATVTIALFTFLTITLFTLMGGVFAPEAIAALIIGIGMSVDANIITFERLKNEFYGGANITKANKRANKQSFMTIFDANITTLIVAVVLFYFGTKDIIGLSLTLMISIILTMVVILFFTRVLSNLLINTGIFNGHEKWLGMRPEFDKKMQEKLNKPDYVGLSKYFSIGSVVFIGIGIIAYSIISGIAMDATAGLNLSQEFVGGTILRINLASGVSYWDETQIVAIRNVLLNNGIHSEEIQLYREMINGSNHVTGISVSVTRDISVESIRHAFTSDVNLRGIVDINSSNTTSAMAAKMVQDALISVALAIGLIIIYTMIRFKWTYSIAAIIALLHDALIVLAFFTIFRIQIAPEFVAGLLSVIGYSINDTIVTFDRIRERSQMHQGKTDRESVINIANVAIKETIKRSLYTSLTTIIAVLILMSFGNATKLSFNIALLVGATAGTYSSIFIATRIWVSLEIRRMARVQKRIDTKYWDVFDVEEQTFVGINDFKI